MTLLALASLLGACQDEARPVVAATQPERLQRASQGLCDALVAAGTGDVERAAASFQDETHGFLHELAGRLSEGEREAAARLLEAKQRVEAVFREPAFSDPAEVSELLGELQSELERAAGAAGLPEPICEGT